MATQVINYDPNQLPNFSGTPAQNASITAILQQKGIVPPNIKQPYSPGGSCDPSVIGLMLPSEQSYATSLCKQGKSAFLISGGLNNYDLSELAAGVAALPSSLQADANFAINGAGAPPPAPPGIPLWVWILIGAGAVLVLTEVVN